MSECGKVYTLCQLSDNEKKKTLDNSIIDAAHLDAQKL
jgi:hypothetical protein